MNNLCIAYAVVYLVYGQQLFCRESVGIRVSDGLARKTKVADKIQPTWPVSDPLVRKYLDTKYDNVYSKKQ